MPRTRGAGNKRAKMEEPESCSLSQKLRRKMVKAGTTPGKSLAEGPSANSKKAALAGVVAAGPKKSAAEHQSGGCETPSFLCDFSKRKVAPEIPVSTIFQRMQRSLNFIHFQYQAALGLPLSHSNRQGVKEAIAEDLESWTYTNVMTAFDRRVTALEWHPTQSNVLVAASKAGDMVVWDVRKEQYSKFVQGIGPGGSISAIRFHPHDHSMFFTTSLDGRLALNSLESLETLTNVLLTGTWERWFTSLDVSGRNNVVLAGDNTGQVFLKTLEWETVMEKKLHKNKVTHAEFSPREDWLLCTASVDHTVKMWDIRRIKDKTSYLACLPHDYGINSAYFSRTDGCRLLTTDQQMELRVYRAPDWHLERTILHPHRFFQHITPIKASWHPLQDLIVVGRYPDAKFPGFQDGDRKTINIIDADTGSNLSEVYTSHFKYISPLNKFNPSGEMLASGMGQILVVWRRPVLHGHQDSEVHGRRPDPVDRSDKPADSGRRRGGSTRREKTPRSKKTQQKTV